MRNHRLRKQKPERSEGKQLAEENQNVTQLADREALFSVLQTQLPDVGTGNEFLLIIRLDEVDKDQYQHTGKTYQTERKE